MTNKTQPQHIKLPETSIYLFIYKSLISIACKWKIRVRGHSFCKIWNQWFRNSEYRARMHLHVSSWITKQITGRVFEPGPITSRISTPVTLANLRLILRLSTDNTGNFKSDKVIKRGLIKQSSLNVLILLTATAFQAKRARGLLVSSVFGRR